jgi:hypothetical protein
MLRSKRARGRRHAKSSTKARKVRTAEAKRPAIRAATVHIHLLLTIDQSGVPKFSQANTGGADRAREPPGLNHAPGSCRVAAADSDVLDRFLADAIADGTPQDRVQAMALLELFNAWAGANGLVEWSSKRLGCAMRARGIVKLHSNVNYWIGIRAVRQANDLGVADGVTAADARGAASSPLAGVRPPPSPPSLPKQGGFRFD